MRRIRSFPEQKVVVVDAYTDLLKPLTYDVLADVPTAATPIVASLSDKLRVPQITPRMDQKAHGTGAKIDGVFKEGDTTVVVDDLITKATSKLEAIEVLESAGLKVTDVVVLIDREQGGRQELEERGYQLHAALTLPHMVSLYKAIGLITPEQFETVMDYLKA